MTNGKDKVCVVTGALGAIGMPICKGLARQGCTVVMVGRDAARTKAGRDEVAQATGNDAIETLVCDLGSLASIRQAAAELAGRHPRIHVLVTNAAAFSKTRKTTADGFELQFGTNHLAHFLFTNLLEAPLQAAGNARVVVMGMRSKTPMAWDDLMLEKKYDGMLAYQMSKAANLYFARELAARWKGQVAVHAVHPGMVKTTLIAEAPLPIRIVFAIAASSPEKGADTPVWAATAPELEGVTGRFYIKRKDTPFPAGADDPALWRRLWEESARLVKLEQVKAA
jgi:NAD(P)-dependent dehydrogenase (short-subunit alcohol dehydrogenase family)